MARRIRWGQLTAGQTRRPPPVRTSGPRSSCCLRPIQASYPGSLGNKIAIEVHRADLGDGSADPQFVFDDTTDPDRHVLHITLNTNPDMRTTAQVLVDAINNDPVASGAISAELVGADAIPLGPGAVGADWP
jgi:hypothetical protein